MSLFKRLKNITMSNINSMLDKAEDPEKMLEQYLREMGEDILDAEKAVAKQIAIEKKFKVQLEDIKEMVEKRSKQAMKAVESGNDDLARRALEDKKEQENKLTDLDSSYTNAKTNADKLRKQLSEMKDQYDKMKAKKETLKARASAAKAQKDINQAMSGFSTDGSTKGFDRMEEKVLGMEAEAETAEELHNSNKSLDDELDALGTNDVDNELAALKAKMNKKDEE